jgi:hypothetical protein
MKNVHDNDRAREIAENNTILRVQVGSGLHGITVAAQDDRDEMAICIEPKSCVIGLEKVPLVNSKGYVNWEVFEQYQTRTQPEGVRSGPGDLDYVCYSLRKWAKLAANGNPTVLLMLFVPQQEIVEINSFGRSVQDNAEMFLSRECGSRFYHYLQAQKERLLGERNQRTNRPELKDKWGFDCKFAYHAIRLGIQGIELLTTRSIELPMAEPAHTWLTDLRVGGHSLEEAIEKIESLQYILRHLAMSADLPPHADLDKINDWLIDMYERWWESALTTSRESIS